MNARVIWIVVIVILVIVGGIVTLIAGSVFALFGMMNNADAHVCGMAAVQQSDVAADMVGTPIVQKGFTTGSTNNNNGEVTEHLTWTVSGPKGEATVVADGTKSGVESHLNVKIGRNGEGQTIYDGKFDCNELHAKK